MLQSTIKILANPNPIFRISSSCICCAKLNIAKVNTPNGKVSAHQPRLKGKRFLRWLRVIKTAIANHQKPKPRRTKLLNSPSCLRAVPKSINPNWAKSGCASLPRTNKANAPVPIGPSASQPVIASSLPGS